MEPASLGEELAIVLSRELRDGERAIIGTASDIQVGAANLARKLHAPGLWWVSGPGGMVNPSEPVIRSTMAFENTASAEAMLELSYMIDFIDWRPHFFDFAILGAMQVDRFGNINTVCIGDHARPRVRGPGIVGISALCGLSRRFYILLTRHDRRVFVPRVDFIAGAGHLEGGRSRAERGLPEGGPALVISPLGTFDFHPESKAMRIRTVTAGVTVEEIQERTGFELIVEGNPPKTTPLAETELVTLRSAVDRTGVLRRKYPAIAAKGI
ncbi:MAG: CoA-transferase [Azospirillaceae bacterium]